MYFILVVCVLAIPSTARAFGVSNVAQPGSVTNAAKSLQEDYVVKLYKIEECLKDGTSKIEFQDILFYIEGKDNYIINATTAVADDIGFPDEGMEWGATLSKCSGSDFLNCQHYLETKSEQFCSKIEDEEYVYHDAVIKIGLQPKCPFLKGSYPFHTHLQADQMKEFALISHYWLIDFFVYTSDALVSWYMVCIGIETKAPEQPSSSRQWSSDHFDGYEAKQHGNYSN